MSKVPPRATSLYLRADRDKLFFRSWIFGINLGLCMVNSFGFLEAGESVRIASFATLEKGGWK